MKKLLLVSVVMVLALSGCVNQNTEPEPTGQPEEVVINTTFDHPDYTLELPAEFKVTSGVVLEPVNKGDFHYLQYDDVEKTEEFSTIEKIIEIKNEFNKNLCGQTEGCPEMIFNEETEIGGHAALRMTDKGEGRAIDDPEGFHYGYEIVILKDEKMYIFKTSATDQDDYEAIEQELAAIVETIKFK